MRVHSELNFVAMKKVVLFFLASLFTQTLSSKDAPAKAYNSQITVMGIVYCDICSNNSFSRHSYFLPGVEVKVDCKFKAFTKGTSEEMEFSVRRRTNRHGVYKLQVPAVDGIECAGDAAVQNSCEARLVRTPPSTSCTVPGRSTTTDEITVKSKQGNVCIYSLGALNYKPSRIDVTLCGR